MAQKIGPTWLAYIDQLERTQALSSDQIAELRKAIEKGEGNEDLEQLKSLASLLEKSASQTKSAADSVRLQALAEILRRPAL